jgi:hypothetical protein
MEREMDFREYQEWIIFLNSLHDQKSGQTPASSGSDWQSQLNFMRFLSLKQQATRRK